MFSSAHRTGKEFEDPDVVRCYAFRPAYPPALHERLVALAPGPGHALDLGCGPGKLAIALSSRFEQVTAVDP
jgi:methylase of polypeptide subunit release factors